MQSIMALKANEQKEKQSAHSFTSPLRYPGGKGELLGFVKRAMIENGISGGQYAEPYAGGASIAMGLLFDEVVQKIHINDLDLGVWSFWSSVLNVTDALCQKIADTPVTVDEWRKQRAIFRDPTNHSTLDVGFSTFFLNRANRSGILSAGIIGGKSQTGKWKMDARFNKLDLIVRIRRIASYRSRILLHNKDTAAFITEILPMLDEQTLVYFDPPYYHKGQKLYSNFYEPAHHQGIADLITSIRQPWIVSYDHCDEIESLYSGYRKLVYKISYSAQVRREGSEIMFFSDGFQPPEVEDPRRVKRKDRQVQLL